MDFVGSKYYELNRTFLSSIGLWPYDESIFKQIKMLVSFGFLVSCSAGMIARIITSKYDMVITLRILSVAIPCLIVIVKYITFLLLPANLKKLMEWVQNDWNTLKDMKELEIIQRYTRLGRFCTITFSVFGYACACSLLILVFLPYILDISMPLNASRERRIPIDVEYFIDEEAYFYTIFCHIYITLIVGITTALATESLYVTYVHHACGMFKIASYRLHYAFDQYAVQLSALVKDATVRTKITDAIEIHKRALGFHDFLWSKLALSYFIILLIGVASLSINLLRVFRAIVVLRDTEETLTSVMFVLAHFIYIFCGNYAGQVFIDHSADIHENVYDSRWYRIPPRQQKLMLFILHRSMHSCKLITGGTFVLSLEGFTTLLAMSISYFTVLSSIQN